MFQYVIFTAIEGKIKRSGDNSGYILNAAGVEHTGESFTLNPGTVLLVVPQQPEGEGPWHQHRLTFINSQFHCNETYQYTAYRLENRWMNKSILIQKGITLEKLLEHNGIGHNMAYTTHKELIKIQNYDFPTEHDPPISNCCCKCRCNTAT